MENLTNLPTPLVDVHVDLRDFPFMPLDAQRLRDSDLSSLPDAEARWANIMSWCAAWHQVPAGSLPDDDILLARLCGYGKDLRTWRRLRKNGALRGYVKCSDGRLYHPVVCEKVQTAYAGKLAQKARTEAARAAKQAAKSSADQSAPPTATNNEPTKKPSRSKQPIERIDWGASVTSSVATDVTEPVTSSKGYGEGEGYREGSKKEPPSLREAPAPIAPAEPPPPPRASRLSDDWTPGSEGRRFAMDLMLDPDAVFAGFRDYWKAKGGADARKVDWQATWRNWCRREKPKGITFGNPRPMTRSQALDEQGEMVSAYLHAQRNTQCH